MSPERTKLKDMTNQGLDEGDSDDAQDEEDVYQPKKYEYVALNPFKDLYKQSPLIQMSFEFGPSCIPLSAIGMILNYTGNHLLQFIHNVLGKRIFFPAHKVVSVQLMNNGDIITTAMRKEISIVLNDKQNEPVADATDAPAAEESEKETKFEGPFKIVQHAETQVTFRSKAIVLSNGGQQQVHPQFFDWFPFMKERKEDLFLSDYMLQEKGYKEVLQRIKERGKKKIVIMGGSHSGFSAAWLLLNGPADLLHNTHVIPTVQYVKKNTGKFSFPGAANRRIENCQRCCVCSYIPKKQKSKGPCKCLCKCYGFFRYSDWGIDYEDLPKFQDADITILYRDRIRVFYSRVQQAQAEGYTDFKNLQFQNKNGFLYSFTGLRGDAKRMYKAIQNGSEKRVRLVKAPTPADQQKYLESADLVIWACGYQTNRIPVKDIDNKVIQMSAKVPFTQFDVDSRCRIITSDNGLLMKTFGTGLAYPVRTNDGMTLPESGKSNPRADGFSLYMNYVAKTLLANLLPKNRLMNKNHRTMRLQGKKTVAAQALQNERAVTMANTNVNNANNNKPPGTSSNWQRSGSEQAPVHRSNTLATRPVITKPTNVNAQANTQTLNISKVQSSPVKPTPTKALQSNSNLNVTPVQKPQSYVQTQQTLVTSAGEDVIDNHNLPVPGYLASNYITEQRKVAKEQSMSPAPKKRSWVPSSKLGPAQNKIPKDTNKALELRLAAENQKQQFAQDGSNIEGGEYPAMQIQLQLSESGKAFQAASQSFNMLKQQQQQPVVSNQNNIYQQHSRYTLKTTEFASVFPSELSGGSAIHYGAMGHSQQPEFLKNYSAQQSYGGSGAPITVASLVEKAASLEKSNQAYSAPQKNSSNKAGGVHGASPLVYNHKSTLIDNTPQVQKSKASFKMVKSVSKTDEFTSIHQPVLVDKRYSPTKAWDPNAPTSMHPQQIVKLMEATQQSGVPSNQNLHNLLQSQNSAKMQHYMAPQQVPPFKQQQVAANNEYVKPVSSSGLKRHPATANQGPASNSPNKKKNSYSKNRDKAAQQTGPSSNSTNNTTLTSNQKSVHNSNSKKRAGNFLKNCKAKFQAQSSGDQSDLKHGEIRKGQDATTSSAISPEKSLSHLASAGQRQIFSDESGSVSSAKRQTQIQNRGSDMNIRTYNGHTTSSEFNQTRQLAIDKLQINHQAASTIISHTPKNQKPPNQASSSYPGSKVSTSQQNKRKSSNNVQQSEQQQINAPLNGNYLTSEDMKSDQGLYEKQKNDFQQFNDREFNELRNEPHSTTGFDRSAQLKTKDSRLVQDPYGSPLPHEAATLSINRTTTVAKMTNVATTDLTHNPDRETEFSPKNSKMQRPSSRQKSASRTHRSLSKGKVHQTEGTTALHQKNFTTKQDEIDKGPHKTVNIQNAAQMITTSSQLQQPVLSQQENGGMTSFGHQQQQQPLKNGQVQIYLSATPGSQINYVSPEMQVRKSMSGYDARMVQTMTQQSTAQVPVKIFQLPVQGGAHQPKQFASAQFKHQNVIPTSQQMSGATYIQGMPQPSMSPQPVLGGHKKSAMSQHQPYYLQNTQPKVVQIKPSGQVIQHSRVIGGSPQTTLKLDHSKIQQSQTQIAQYGLMQVAASQNVIVKTQAMAQQHQKNLVPGSQMQAYQGRSQQFNNQATQGYHQTGGSTTNHLVVRKPVAASIQIQQNKTAAAVNGVAHPAQSLMAFSPVKLSNHQKNAHLQQYQQLSQPGGQLSMASSYSKSGNPQHQSHLPQRRVETNSPMILKTNKSGLATNNNNINSQPQTSQVVVAQQSR